MTEPSVGDRVVVRRLLPSGQATDVIGTLEADGDPLVVVREGSRVPIPRADVVAYKAIPARPIRNRDIRALTRAQARSWASTERAEIDGWLCRSGGGLPGGRANSAAPLEPVDSLEGPRAWYADRGIPLQVQWVDRLMPGPRPELERPSGVFVVDPRAIAARSERVSWDDGPPEAWLALQSGAATSAAWVSSVLGSVAFGSLTVGGATAAVARLSLTRDGDTPDDGLLWSGIGSLVVGESFRRQGLATELVRDLAREALSRGADRCFLEVLDTNAPARAMYTALGFTQHHTYGYRLVP
ncbi:GNAT family N-acetyltransferase [Tsukamurella sp. 8F]|uniref:GNAT family N-acetyltransferase n=1 Tax=unclassified Tsukamurella TaxID=2633480 RepID=UPI0023B9D0E9|nr:MULTISPECIES: GNAT family N-acetyltransferase [unclassified Tsukamurella]MDF0529482.1 GNAT family N-acetyltransferase [Tsukamurella sp. 8J]MDF0585830.1 GNAT family N-acetyltransferase [Tsukamurella sp. 8F]